MALHELATNAVKYGALSNDQGRISLRWDIVTEGRAAQLWLRWEEAGGRRSSPRRTAASVRA